MKKITLLTLDAVINLILGLLLLFFPKNLVVFLGVPSVESAFYPNILGAVLFGIGIALLVNRCRETSGLGLLGAISINLCGGITLAIWLLTGDLTLPVRGFIFLWTLVLLLIGISGFELISSRSSQEL